MPSGISIHLMAPSNFSMVGAPKGREVTQEITTQEITTQAAHVSECVRTPSAQCNLHPTTLPTSLASLPRGVHTNQTATHHTQETERPNLSKKLFSVIFWAPLLRRESHGGCQPRTACFLRSSLLREPGTVYQALKRFACHSELSI